MLGTCAEYITCISPAFSLSRAQDIYAPIQLVNGLASQHPYLSILERTNGGGQMVKTVGENIR